MAIIFNGNLEINIGPHVRVRRENPVVHKPKRAKRIKWLDPDNMLQTRSRQIITLRVGLFFDGTGNNMENAIAADCQLEYDPEVLKDLEFLCEDEEVEHGREGSHQNAPSNIVRLYELYRDDSERLLKDGDAASIPVYIEGIGTVTGGKDDWYAQITGMGRNGVNSRVEQSPQSIAKRVDELLERNPNVKVGCLEIDVFGFSRGAAAARHCVNEVIKGNNGEFGRLWQDNEAWFADDFAGEYGSQLKVNFVGLFDSVPAIMGLLKDADPRLAAISPALLIARGDYSTANARNPGLAQYLPPDKVGKVVHLRARDEYREGFALNSVQPDHHEALLPGVHSDIGGGYLREQAEQHWLTRPRASSASFIASAESTPAYRQSQQDLEEWKRAHPHLADHPGLSIRVRTRSPRSGSAYWTGGQQRRVHTVATLNRVVRGELSLVYLHIMRELAAEQGVPLEPITPEDQALALPADLEAIYPKLLAQTQDGQDRLTDTEKQALYQRYVHVSAHWNRLTPALPLAVMKPADNYERIVHLHEAD